MDRVRPQNQVASFPCPTLANAQTGPYEHPFVGENRKTRRGSSVERRSVGTGNTKTTDPTVPGLPWTSRRESPPLTVLRTPVPVQNLRLRLRSARFLRVRRKGPRGQPFCIGATRHAGRSAVGLFSIERYALVPTMRTRIPGPLSQPSAPYNAEPTGVRSSGRLLSLHVLFRLSRRHDPGGCVSPSI